MSAMKAAEIECRETMEALLLEDLDNDLSEDVLGRNLHVALKNVQHYRDLVVTCQDPRNQEHFAKEVEWLETRAIETIFEMQHPC